MSNEAPRSGEVGPADWKAMDDFAAGIDGNRLPPTAGLAGTSLTATDGPALVELATEATISSSSFEQVADFIVSHDSSSIGIAGNRGVGKSTVMDLLRRKMDGVSARVQAPVLYDPPGGRGPPTIPTVPPRSRLLTMVGIDRAQAESARFTANAFARTGVPTYLYRFSYVPTARRGQWVDGVPHGAEIPFVFDTLAARGTQPTAEDSAVARLTNTYWANFARMGNPNGSTAPPWPRQVVGVDSITDFTPDGTVVAGPDPRKERPRPR